MLRQHSNVSIANPQRYPRCFSKRATPHLGEDRVFKLGERGLQLIATPVLDPQNIICCIFQD